jgi:hypothetical protein
MLISGKEPDSAHGEMIGEGAVNRDNRMDLLHRVIQDRD